MLQHGVSSSEDQEAPKEEVEMSSITQIEDDNVGPEAHLIAPDLTLPRHGPQDSRTTSRKDHVSHSEGSPFLWILTCVACVSGLLFGYDTGVISATMVSVGSDLSGRPLTILDKSLITSCTSLFALIASPVAGIMADRWGRKIVILCADVLFAAGALGQTSASTVWGLVIGRSVLGLAIGGASFNVPLYISELAPGHMRGRLVTVSLLFITGGQVVAYVVGWILSSAPGGWRWMVGLGALPAIIQSTMLIFMPESPRWLVKAGQEDRARLVLQKVYHRKGIMVDDSVSRILCSIKAEVLAEEEISLSSHKNSANPSSKLSSLLLRPANVRALTIACLLQGLQQLCGFNSLMYFSATIFESLEFSSPTLTSLSVAATNFVATSIAFHFIDRVGRRKILLYTIPGMAVSLFLCAIAFRFVSFPPPTPSITPRNVMAVSSSPPPSGLPALAILICLILYVAHYATGLGPIPWQQSELFPLNVRSLGSSLSTATNWLCNFVVGLTFLPMMEALTPAWTFVTYGFICALGWLAIWHIYPETMGLELEDVGELLKDGWGVKESLRRVGDEQGERGAQH